MNGLRAFQMQQAAYRARCKQVQRPAVEPFCSGLPFLAQRTGRSGTHGVGDVDLLGIAIADPPFARARQSQRSEAIPPRGLT
jgi:hypothetical protein